MGSPALAGCWNGTEIRSPRQGWHLEPAEISPAAGSVSRFRENGVDCPEKGLFKGLLVLAGEKGAGVP
jgi:hypothetical protein